MMRFCFILIVIGATVLAACLPFDIGPQQTNPGETLFFDDFSDPSSGWERFTSAEGTMDYDGNGFRFLVNSLDTNFWSTPEGTYRDVRVEVDVAKINGPDENRIGLLCRYLQGNYYFFMVSSDGYYTIGKFLGGNVIQMGQSQMEFNPSIHTGLAINHLRGDCIGDRFTFYVNGSPVAQAQDPDLSEGGVGLLAGTFGQPGVDVLFDNFFVLQP